MRAGQTRKPCVHVAAGALAWPSAAGPDISHVPPNGVRVRAVYRLALKELGSGDQKERRSQADKLLRCAASHGQEQTWTRKGEGESVCCLLVLDSVTSTPQWIRQPKPRDVHDVYVFVCKCVLSSPRASQPLNVFAYAFSSTSAFSLRLMTLRLAGGATPAFIGVSAPPLPSLTAAQRIHPPRNCPMLTVGYNNTTITAL